MNLPFRIACLEYYIFYLNLNRLFAKNWTSSQLASKKFYMKTSTFYFIFPHILSRFFIRFPSHCRSYSAHVILIAYLFQTSVPPCNTTRTGGGTSVTVVRTTPCAIGSGVVRSFFVVGGSLVDYLSLRARINRCPSTPV